VEVKKALLLWPGLAVLALDQATKYWIAARFPVYETKSISAAFSFRSLGNRVAFAS
jgi:lipoprotein signal peptidase